MRSARSLGSILGVAALAIFLLTSTNEAVAHGVAADDAAFLRNVSGTELMAFLYLGAKHMVTGYDHIIFLVAVLFFIRTPRDVILYVSLFSLGHSITLLVGVATGLQVSAQAVDALIGMTIAYKALDNLSGFGTLFGRSPDNRLMVFAFGLIHGLGLATKIQSLGLGGEGLIYNLLAFNLGVEIGQVLVLLPIVAMLLLLPTPRPHGSFAKAANVLLMILGFVLAEYQLAALVVLGNSA